MVMKKRIPYRCPYQIDKSCDKLDNLLMTMSCSCQDCEHYNDGIIPTGSIFKLRIKNWDWESFILEVAIGVLVIGILILLII